MTRMTKFRHLAPAFALLSVMLAPAALRAQSSDRAKQLGNKLMCNCGCSDLAGQCSHPGSGFSGPCDTAKATLKQIDDKIAQGMSDDQILQSFVQEQGEAILAAPQARGFSMVAWVIPGAVFALGLGLVVMVIRTWRHRPVPVAAVGPPVSAEFLEQARRQIDRDTED